MEKYYIIKKEKNKLNIIYKKSNIILFMILLLSCSSIPLYKSKFIDIGLTDKVKINMNIDKVKSIIGEPNYVELQTDEIDNKIIVHYYYIRDKVYLHSKIPTTNVISEKNLVENKIIGYGDQKKFILYYYEGLLFKTKVSD